MSLGVSGQEFGYIGRTLTPDNPPQIIIGTNGTADLIILKTPGYDFTNWISQQPQISGSISDCPTRFFFNVTTLASYLRTHQAQIAYSQTIVDPNVTVDYPLTKPTNVTIAWAHMGSGWTRDYWSTTMTNRTLTYPLLGYTERPGTAWSLPNISLGLLAAGIVSLVVVVIELKPDELLQWKPVRGPAPVTRECPECGRQNLFFAEKCLHCGSILHNERVESPWHRN